MVACNGRKSFMDCRSWYPLREHHSEPAARYEAHRAGWTTFGEKDYCPSCSREQAAFAATASV